jgi:hypothetical protein
MSFPRPPPGSSNGPNAGELVVELDPFEAASGAAKQIVIPAQLPEVPKLITIQIPAGVRDGALLRLPGGGAGEGGRADDVLVRVRVRPPPAGGSTKRLSRPLARALVGGVVLAVIVSVVALVGLGQSDDFPNPEPAAASSSPTASSPASGSNAAIAPAALSPAKYQGELTALDTALAASVKRVRAARSPAALSGAVERLEQSVTEQADKLRGVSPPVAISAEHGALVDALDALADELIDIGAAADAAEVCLGSSGTASIGQSSGAAEVRTAVADLVSADPAHRYRVRSFLPAKTAAKTRRLRNGTVLKRPNGGYGRLSIDNGGSVDAVVSLVRRDAKKPSMSVYVRAHDSFTVSRISDGTYHIFITAGGDWDKAAKRFSRNCSFEKFDEPAKFTTKFTSTAIEYSVHEISITPVIGGNATVSEVAPDAFPASG